MVTPQQVADYIRKYKDSFSIEALRQGLAKQGLPDAVISEGMRLALAAAPAAAPAAPAAPALFLEGGVPHWRARIATLQEFRGVRKTIEFRLCCMPAGAVVCWILRIFKDPQNPLQLCQVADPRDAWTRPVLESLVQGGKLVVRLEGPQGGEGLLLPVPCDTTKLARLLAQASSYNGRLSRHDGPAALREFVAAFAPVFQKSGFDAAWDQVQVAAARVTRGEDGSSQPVLGAQEELDAVSSIFESSPGPISAGAESGADEEFERVVGGLGPDLYERNVFRAAELLPDAPIAELRKRLQFMEMAVRTGSKVPAGSFRVLPPAGEAAAKVLREGVERVQDPWQRLVEEVFWFWPAPDAASKQAFGALAAGDAAGAAKVWEGERSSGAAGDLAVHNLAVLHHLSALSLESGKEAQRRDAHWSGAVECWNDVLARDAFWSLLASRIRRLGDRRMGTSAAASLRRLLPKALLSVSAGLMVKAAEGADGEGARRHAGLMRAIEAGDAQEAVLALAARPLSDRVKALCDAALEDLDNDVGQGYEISRRLMAQAEPLLAVMESLFPQGGAARDAARDQVAETIRAAVIKCGNLEENRAQGEQDLDLYLAALGIAAGEQTGRRLEECVKNIKEFLEKQKDAEEFKPRESLNHGRAANPKDADFFWPPPPEIGPVLSAQTSLDGGNQPKSLSTALLGLAPWIAVGIGLGVWGSGIDGEGFFTLLLSSLPLVAVWKLWLPWTRFSQSLTYIGTKGVARASFWYDRGRVRSEVFLFVRFAELFTARTRHFYNYAYTHTDYSFRWSGKQAFSVSGSYRAEDSRPPAADGYHFGDAAEDAWTRHLLAHAEGVIKKEGSFRFNVSGSSVIWIAVGPGFIEVPVDGKAQRWKAADIARVALTGAEVKITRNDAKSGWFSSSGTVTLSQSGVANVQVFLALLKGVAGVAIA